MSSAPESEQSARTRMLTGIPIRDRRLSLAGVQTAVLDGGVGQPLVLLHGPGEFAAGWIPVMPQLLRTHRVIAPDLPGHGASAMTNGGLDADEVLSWLGELIEATCAASPVVIGRVGGGAIAARFAADHGDRLAHLVLVDTFGLTSFEPDPRFGLAMHRFLARPSAGSYDLFMEFCTYDLDRVREQLGQRWAPYASYAVELASTPSVQAAMGGLIGQFAAAPIPPAVLSRIDVPTTLIWGRHDLATPVRLAETAAARYGWRLNVIEDAGDDPALEQPDAFLEALGAAIGAPITDAAAS